MELLLSTAIAVLAGAGVYLMLARRSYPAVLGTLLISYAVNLFILASGRLTVGAPPIAGTGPTVDPLPQALVLTAIVIGFALTALALALAVRAAGELGDGVDGEGP